MTFPNHVIAQLLIVVVMGACSSPIAISPTASVQAKPSADYPLVAGESTRAPTIPPAMSPTAVAEELIYPFYLPYVTKLENVAQTIDGVTAQIDWVYIDESRIAVQYTISGLTWPDGSTLDTTLQPQISIPALTSVQFGGFSGAGGSNSGTVKQGVLTGSSDQALLEGALDAEKFPAAMVKVRIPVQGPTKIGTFNLSFTAPVTNGIKLENIDQTVTANHVSMTLKSLILNPSYAEALVCFQMPSALDWGLTASTIAVGDQEYPFTRGELFTPKNTPDAAVTAAERCNKIGFDVYYDATAARPVTLIVPKLIASVNEVVSEDTVDKANQRLADIGIAFQYENIDHGGNIVILQRPDGMPDSEMYTLIWDALAEQYEGPWVLMVEIPK